MALNSHSHAQMTGLSVGYIAIIAPAILIAAVIATVAIMYTLIGLALVVRRARDGTLFRRRGRVSPIASTLHEVRVEPIDDRSSRQGSHKAQRIDVQPIAQSPSSSLFSAAGDGKEADTHVVKQAPVISNAKHTSAHNSTNQSMPQSSSDAKSTRASNISTASSSTKSTSGSAKVTHIRVAPSPTTPHKATQG